MTKQSAIANAICTLEDALKFVKLSGELGPAFVCLPADIAYAIALLKAPDEPKAECPHCREVYEIWAGIEGFIPATAPEAYQQRIIDQMREAAARGLSVKNRT